MKKYVYKTLSHLGTVTTVVDGEHIEAENGSEFYYVPDVDAREAQWLAIDRAQKAKISDYDDACRQKQECIDSAKARIADLAAREIYLERRLFECESAMLMGHDVGKIRYMDIYPDPIELPR